MHRTIRVPQLPELEAMGINPARFPLHLHVRQTAKMMTAVHIRFHLAVTLMAREIDNSTVTGYYAIPPEAPVGYLDAQGDRLVDFTMTALGPIAGDPCYFMMVMHMTVEDGPYYELCVLYGTRLKDDSERPGVSTRHSGLGNRVFEAWSVADGRLVALNISIKEIGQAPETFVPDLSMLTDDLFRELPHLHKLEQQGAKNNKLIIPGR